MTPGVAALLKTGVYEANVSPESWRADFAEISRIDEHAEHASGRWTGVIIGSAIAFLVSLAFLAADDRLASSVATFSMAASAAFLVLAAILRSTASRHDYENRRYELAQELVELLSADLPRGGRLTVRLDLRPVDHASKQLPAADVNGWREKHFVDPFLQLQARLCDGTGVSVHVVDHRRVRSRWKVGRSGKMKHKSKSAKWVEAIVKVKVEPERAQAAVQQRRANPALVQLPRRATFNGLVVSPKGLVARAWSEWTWTAPAMAAAELNGRDLVAQLLVSVFQLLGASQAPTSRSA